MNRKLYITLVLTIVAFSFESSICDSPIVGDHSGAPGETSCAGCHSSPVNPDLPELHFEVGNNDSTYVAGNTYAVHISISKPGHNKFGFVCSSLDSLNSSKGTFALLNTVTTRKYSLGGRDYVSHTPCGADSVDQISWTFNWTAPSTNKGKIILYMSMLVANHDHALTGDTTYTRQILLKPAVQSDVWSINESASSKVYPTIFTDKLTVEFNQLMNSDKKGISLMNMQGQIVEQYLTDKSNIVIPINHSLSNGVYFMRINNGTAIENFKIIKQ